jgi:hypothetical protein
MLKIRFVSIFLVVALALGVTGAALAQDPGPVPVPPTLKLSVTQSPLTIYPPVMIYTAQLSYVPPTPSALLKVDYYNVADTGGLVYLGSATVDKTGKAVLNKQMHPGTYTAIARVVINQQVVWSNRVVYTVR